MPLQGRRGRLSEPVAPSDGERLRQTVGTVATANPSAAWWKRDAANLSADYPNP